MGSFNGGIDVGSDAFNYLFDQAGSRRRRKLENFFEEIVYAHGRSLRESTARFNPALQEAISPRLSLWLGVPMLFGVRVWPLGSCRLFRRCYRESCGSRHRSDLRRWRL